MIHYFGMTKFMDNNVINDKFRSFNQSPVQGNIFEAGTTTKFSPLASNESFIILKIKVLGEFLGALA